MAIKQSAYDNLISGISKNEDFSDAFSMIINNPYRILGASTFCDERELNELYEQWKSAPDKYKTKFDKTKLGAPKRTKENMLWALDNADSYVYKIFWFSDADIAARLGSKGDFIEFFGKKQGVNSTDYNSFLAQYIFLCVFDRNFTMTEQWGIILNLINDLLNLSVGRFWGFFSGNKIEALDNNKMAFLYNEFKDNILFPIREIIAKQAVNTNLEEIIHIHTVLTTVEKAQLPFAKLQNMLYEKLEKWFIKEADYVNNVLLANVTDVNATSMEEKLAITNAYNYIISDITPNFTKIVGNIIPLEHSMNTKLRMMFSGKFIVVSKILANTGLYNESLKLCQLFNEMFEDEIISGEINSLTKIIKQEETTRMTPHAATATMSNPVLFDDTKSLARPTELGQLEALEKERRKEFFQKSIKTGIDYKEVIQGVINNELRLVKDASEEEKDRIPYVERVAMEAAEKKEAEAFRIKQAIEEMQKKHEEELNNKIKELNAEYKKSMAKWICIILVIVLLTISALGILVWELFKVQSDGNAVLSNAQPSAHTLQLEETLKSEKEKIEDMARRLGEINSEMAELNRQFEETNDIQYTDQYLEKQLQYDRLYEEYTQTYTSYNANLQEYKALQQ